MGQTRMTYPAAPLGALLHLERLRNRVMGVNPLKLLQALAACRGQSIDAPRERLGLSDRILERLGDAARKRVARTPGGATELYGRAIEGKPWRCDFCRQTFSLSDVLDSGYCTDCKTARVTESDYGEMGLRLLELKRIREQSPG